MPNEDLTLVEKQEIAAVPSEDTALAFLDSATIGDALSSSDWTVHKEIEALRAIATDTGEPSRIRILAMDTIHKRLMTALRYSGVLARKMTTQQVTQQDGSTTTVTTNEMSAVRLLQGRMADSERELRSIQNGSSSTEGETRRAATATEGEDETITASVGGPEDAGDPDEIRRELDPENWAVNSVRGPSESGHGVQHGGRPKVPERPGIQRPTGPECGDQPRCSSSPEQETNEETSLDGDQ